MRGVLIFATLGGLGLGGYAAWEEREHRVAAPIPEALAREALARESAVAEQLGFVAAEETAVELSSDAGREGEPVLTVSVDAGECVAAVGAFWGWQHVRHFALASHCEDRDASVSEQTLIHGVALHVQFCSDVPRTLQVCARSGGPTGRMREHERGPRPMALRLLRAPAEVVRGRENRGFALR